MKKINARYLLIVSFFFINPIQAEKLIALFLKPYPVASDVKSYQKLGNKIHRPGKIARNRAKRYLPSAISGVFATFAGYLTISDLNGEIVFPRKDTHSFATLDVICTERLTPVIMSGNTIHHWELEENVPARMYKFEQKVDPETHIFFWDVTQVPLPQNRWVPLESIILLADPKYVYVPLGISTFKDSPHLILPDIYIKKGINLTLDALYIVNLAHYFGALIPLYKKENIRYNRQLTY